MLQVNRIVRTFKKKKIALRIKIVLGAKQTYFLVLIRLIAILLDLKLNAIQEILQAASG